MHADHFDITNKKLAKGAGAIQARKGRIPLALEAALVSGLNPNTLAFLAAALPLVLDTGRSIANQLPAILFIDETALLVVMSTYSI
jgi:threonine/homoserine/homoserine lactone efflux protein